MGRRRHRHLADDRPRRRREHVHAVAEVDGLFDRMRHEKHRRLRFLPEIDQQFLHVQPRRRIQRPERFVHEDDARRQNQRARDRHALPHAAGQLAGVLRGIALHIEADSGDPRARQLAPFGHRHPAALEAERDVVLDRPVVERGVVLKHHASVRPGRHDRPAADQDRAFGGRVVRAQPRNESQHRRFPAAGRPQNGDELTLVRRVLHGERDVANDGQRAEPFRHLVEIDDVGGGAGRARWLGHGLPEPVS